MNVSATSLSLQLAAFRAQSFDALLGPSMDFGSIFQAASSSDASSAADKLAGLTGAGGLSSTGRNTSLFDPESAFNMMSVINQKQADYTAQYSELSDMKSEVSDIGSAAQALSSVAASSSNADVKDALQKFVDDYNAWVKRFDGDMQQGGVLAGTQAAQVARWELDQSVENRFYGVDDGLNGLGSIGITIDPKTKLASFDAAKLDSVLASNRKGVLDTVQEFSAHFSGAAKLLNSAGNFIPNQLNNLGSALQYISNNISSWRSEFGTGAPAVASSAQTAKALAAYRQAA
ncbi:MAG TPA: flagellar filament capping protein FliD [Rhodocyclaceae bacterium]